MQAPGRGHEEANSDEGTQEAAAEAVAGVDLEASPSLVADEEAAEINLQRYSELQERLAQLQGMQIKTQLFKVQRKVSALEQQLGSMVGLLDESKAAMRKAQEAYLRLDRGGWYPGKMLLQNADSKLATAAAALEKAHAEVQQREQQKAEITSKLKDSSRRFMLWKSHEAELEAVQAELEDLEAVFFAADSRQLSQGKMAVVDTLCAMDEQSRPEEPEEVAPSREGAAAAGGQQQRDEYGRWGQGRLLRLIASALGSPKPGEGRHGRWGRGRLLRLSADVLERAASGGSVEVEVEVGAAEGEQGGKVALEVEGKEVEVETVPQEEQKKPGLFQGRLMSALADKLGSVDLGKHKDKFGGWGRGRLLRITADKLRRAAEARRKEREAGLRKVQGGIGARGDGKPQTIPQSLQHLFPKDACSFNPAIDCPPSAFLWPYSDRFLGKLQKLQTGPVLQAFYRFGPFDVDPERPNRLIPADRGNAPPLFLLSGLGSTMIAWGTPLLRALATTHEVIVMEYRGAGLSKNLSDQPWNYYNQAEAVLLLADALGIPQFNWLGWSSGGNTGLVLAALYGDRLHRMASLAGMAGGPNTIVPPAYDMLDPALSLSVGQTMALIFPPVNPAEFKKTCANYIKAVFSMPGAITDQEVGPQAAKEQWVADKEFITKDGRVWDALPGVRCPCLIMNGDRDVLVPHENAVRISGRIPGARLHTWEGWGHGFKDSERLAQVVTDFLLEG
ncbi:hypothetical protein ABPG77_002963 [Micractinium sp. CCAP 211/92]